MSQDLFVMEATIWNYASATHTQVEQSDAIIANSATLKNTNSFTDARFAPTTYVEHVRW